MKEGDSSNCAELMKLIDEYEKLYFNLDSPTKVSIVLGVAWNMESDLIPFDLAEILQNALVVEIVTNRLVLQTLSRIFDPIAVPGLAVFTLKKFYSRMFVP